MHFEEEQYFRQWWMWVILIVTLIVSLSAVSGAMLAEARRGGDTAAAGWSIAVVLLVHGGILLLLLKMHLRTEVNPDGLFVRFFPLHFRTHRIDLANLKSHAAVTYSPIRDYGGWGIRWRPGKGKAYNVSGNRGVQLEWKDGKRLLIGSQQPEALDRAIAQWLERHAARR